MRTIILCTAFAVSSSALAQDSGKQLVGLWKFESSYQELKANGEKRYAFGEKPRGYAYFSPGGRIVTVLTAQERSKPKTEAERAAALSTVYAVSGTYKVTGKNTYTFKADASANENLVGTEFGREFKFEGGKLLITTAYSPSAFIEGNPEARGVNVLTRAK